MLSLLARGGLGVLSLIREPIKRRWRAHAPAAAPQLLALRGHLKEFTQKPRRFPTLGTSVHVCESDDAAMSLRFRNSQVWQPACSLFSSRLTRDSWRWGGCPGVVPRNWTRTMTPRLLSFIAITGLSLLLIVR